MKTYFPEDGESGHLYKIINDIMDDITETNNFYSSIFTDDFDNLDYQERCFILDVIMGEYCLEIKDLIVYSVQ